MGSFELRAGAGTVVDVFDRDVAPVLTVDAGAVVSVQSLDCRGHLQRQRVPGEPRPTVFAESQNIDMGAAWAVGQGRAVYLAPIYMEYYDTYDSELLLDGSQPSSVEMFNRAVEWAGGAAPMT